MTVKLTADERKLLQRVKMSFGRPVRSPDAAMATLVKAGYVRKKLLFVGSGYVLGNKKP